MKNEHTTPISANSTVNEVTIKRRADGVYDVYFDGKHSFSKGNFASVLHELTLMEAVGAIEI